MISHPPAWYSKGQNSGRELHSVNGMEADFKVQGKFKSYEKLYPQKIGLNISRPTNSGSCSLPGQLKGKSRREEKRVITLNIY